ncbi:hypothetical protein TraAM80_10155, partial [Trypanosoma rangeli]
LLLQCAEGSGGVGEFVGAVMGSLTGMRTACCCWRGLKGLGGGDGKRGAYEFVFLYYFKFMREASHTADSPCVWAFLQAAASVRSCSPRVCRCGLSFGLSLLFAGCLLGARAVTIVVFFFFFFFPASKALRHHQ